MSERAEGFIVLGATRARVQRWLGEQRLAAFVAAGPGKALRVWPRAQAEDSASRLTAALENSQVLAWSVGKEEARLAVYAHGQCLASGEVALRLRTAKQLSQGHAALQRVSAALESKHRPPPLLRDGSSLPSFLALAGAVEEEVAGLHYAGLERARRHPEAADTVRFQDWGYVDETGQESPFLPNAEKPAAKKPAVKRPAASKTAATKPAAKSTAPKSPAAKKTAPKRPAAKKPAAKKPAAKKSAAKKPAARWVR